MSSLAQLLTAGWDELRGPQQFEGCPVPIYCRRFTAAHADSFQGLTGGDLPNHAAARLVVRLALDEAGNRLFEPADAETLIAQGNVWLLREIAEWIIDDARSLEEHLGNSPAAPSGEP